MIPYKPPEDYGAAEKLIGIVNQLVTGGSIAAINHQDMRQDETVRMPIPIHVTIHPHLTGVDGKFYRKPLG